RLLDVVGTSEAVVPFHFRVELEEGETVDFIVTRPGTVPSPGAEVVGLQARIAIPAPVPEVKFDESLPSILSTEPNAAVRLQFGARDPSGEIRAIRIYVDGVLYDTRPPGTAHVDLSFPAPEGINGLFHRVVLEVENDLGLVSRS